MRANATAKSSPAVLATRASFGTKQLVAALPDAPRLRRGAGAPRDRRWSGAGRRRRRDRRAPPAGSARRTSPRRPGRSRPRRAGRTSRSPAFARGRSRAGRARVTRSGCVSAYASASVLPHEPPNTCHRSIAEVLAQRLDVRDEVPRRVVDERRVRRALAAAALIEEDDPVRGGIEEAPVVRLRPEARSSVQEDHRLAPGGCRSPRSRARARPTRAAGPCGMARWAGSSRAAAAGLRP